MQIDFNITPVSNENISSFELGDLTIKYLDQIISSKKEEAPYQNFMIFSTISNFLDELRSYIQNPKKQKDIKFKAIGSSFEFQLKIIDDLIILNEIIEVPKELFLETLYKSSKELYDDYINKVKYDDFVMEEFGKSLDNFKATL